MGFALIAPIYLPAGGIQRYLNEYSTLNSSKEIILNSNYSIHCFPQKNSKKLRALPAGSSVYILKQWIGIDKEKWVRVKLSNNLLLNSSNKPLRGWIKI